MQPSLNAGQLRIKDMKLALRAGRSRHYRVPDILGRHFAETGLAAALSREQIAGMFREIQSNAEKAFETALAEMRSGLPMALFDAVRHGFEQRVGRITPMT